MTSVALDGIAQRVLRRSIVWTLAANLVGVGVVSIYTNVVAPFPETSTAVTVVGLLTPLAYAAGAFWVGLWWARGAFARACLYLSEGRAPTDDERFATLGFPAAVARLVLVAWIIGALAVGISVAVDPDSFGHTLQPAVAVLLGGLTTALITFLVLERIFRPLYALVLSADAPEFSLRLGIAHRLLLSWALGSGIPLLILVLAPIGGAISRGRLQSLNWYLGTVGLVVGALLVVITARSVADPISGLRYALRTVQSGTLEVVVPIDDGGEVGLVQAGFNRMVEGLRERQLLQDLFGRHVGVDVARSALERGVQLGGEVQDVSVLFVDLIGSTALAQKLPPSDVVAALNRFFGAVVRATHAEGGWVNKFEGDAALCVFGAPNAMENHASHALRAARSLRGALDDLARDHPGLDAGIGVSSGAVVAGNVGSADRYEYTVIGDPVNEAARLTEVAKQRDERVVASSTVVEAAHREASNWRSSERLTLRGRSAPTHTYVPTRLEAP